MSSDALADALTEIKAGQPGLHSLLLVRHGHVVLDAYFHPYSGDTHHDVASVTKSVTATLIGIAIADGVLEGVNTPVSQALPERGLAGSNWDRITVEHLLTMTSGLDCGYRPGEPELVAMRQSDDWVRFSLDLPVVAEPGRSFAYCSSGMHLLSAILTARTGLNASDFAAARLFAPLGIARWAWPADPDGNSHGWGDLRLLPRDMAKIGFLYLHGGIWDERRLLPAEWVGRASTRQAGGEGGRGYGYGWWVLSGQRDGLYEAEGRGGQAIVVWPEQDLVAVFTGAGYDRDSVAAALTPALVSGSPLPPDPQAVERLLRAVDAAAAPAIAVAPRPLPPLADAISGSRIVLADNALGLSGLTVAFPGGDAAGLQMTFSDRLSDRAAGRYELAVGLDGIDRLSPAGPGDARPAVRGQWVAEDRFWLRYAEANGPNVLEFDLHFADAAVTIGIVSPTGSIEPLTVAGHISSVPATRLGPNR